MTDPRQHQLFREYPLRAEVALSTGSVPTPYHVYAGYGAFIGGTADLAAVEELLRPEQIVPLRNEAGQALMGVWICNFVDASLGPHHELQFSIFVTSKPVPPISAQPLSLLAAMLTNSDLRMLCHGLWNNSPLVVAYNRELLSLNARLTNSQIELTSDRLKFSYRDQADNIICAGHIHQPRKQSWHAIWSFMRQLGFTRMLQTLRQPYVEMRILNPIGVVLPQNTTAQSFTKTDANIIHFFDPDQQLSILDPQYARLGFSPTFIQFMDGFKFVYLHPE
ncbi:MAG: hypothetical protein KF726_00085 [Anaerolineae bacterium]|nr:hypothetical protein [Anaerolineae bacterium]